MKKSIFILPLLFLIFACSSDDEASKTNSDLLGTWELTKIIYSNEEGTREDLRRPGESGMVITEDRWIEVEDSEEFSSFEYIYNPQKKEVVILGIVMTLEFSSPNEMILKRTRGAENYYKRIK